MEKFVYNFEASQPLTKEQLYLLNCILQDFFLVEPDENLVPEWTTEIELEK